MNRFYLLLVAGLLATNVMADNKQTVTIGGSTVEGKTVTEITFDGDNVTLKFSDNSTQTEDMSLVKLAFTYDGTTGIQQVEHVQKALQGKVYNLNGQLVGTSTEGLTKGVYIVNGKKVIIK